jgi:predicted Fe-Mo cluster-binding NifX family protein
MKVGITSQNFRTITGHAGKTRRFLVYDVDESGQWQAQESLDLPKEMSLHEYHGDNHPAYALDVIITAGCGEGFRRRMHSHGVKVIATSESDPVTALSMLINDQPLPEPVPHDGH